MAPDIPPAAFREIARAAERAVDDLRWIVGDGPGMPEIVLRLAIETWRAGRAHRAEQDL